jgi:GNAT superfamily N-acetyltransferase
MARIDFRSTTVADEPAIVALLQEAQGTPPGYPMFEHRHLYWKYWQPHEGWQGSRSYVLTKDDQVIAHGAVVPAVCAWGGDRINMLHVIDWAARPDARGAGAALMQHIARLADAIVTSSGSDMALRLLPFMGFKESNTIVTGYARPIRPLLYLRGANDLSWRLVARCSRNVLWALRAPSRENGSRHARPLRADEVAATPIPWPAPKYGTAVLERTSAMMSYWLGCPAVHMELYVVENGRDAEGYFVLAFAPGQARLVDCWYDGDAPSGWEALVDLAVQQARRHQGVAEVAATCSEPLLADALQRCGFHARYSRPLFLRATSGGRVPDLGVRIQMLDDDAAYLHGGSKHFWA